MSQWSHDFFLKEGRNGTTCTLHLVNPSKVIIKVRYRSYHLAPMIYSWQTGTIVLACWWFKWGPLLEQQPGFNEFSRVCVSARAPAAITLLKSSQIRGPTNTLPPKLLHVESNNWTCFIRWLYLEHRFCAITTQYVIKHMMSFQFSSLLIF